MTLTEEQIKILGEALGETDVWGDPDEFLKNQETTDVADSGSETPPIDNFEAWKELSVAARQGTSVGNDANRAGEDAAPAGLADGENGNKQPGTEQLIVAMENLTFSSLNLEKGDLSSPEGESFCPWRVVVQYPDNFIGNANRPKAKPYFEQEVIHEFIDFDFFYLYNPERNAPPYLLIPTAQFVAFLDAVNQKIGTHLTIPGGPNQDLFFLQFGEGNGPRPRYLGKANSEREFCELYDARPDPTTEDSLNQVTEFGRQHFREMIQLVSRDPAATKSKKNKSIRKAAERVQSHTEWGHAIKRVQRYLGLRGRNVPGCNRGTSGTKTSSSQVILNVDEPAPYKPDGSVVFVCVDIEAYERSQQIVTEVGFGILDTLDLVGVAPGKGGTNWFQHIQGRHLRIAEYLGVQNHEFVAGCPANFLFGESETVKLCDINKAIVAVMEEAARRGSLNGQASPKRDVILVGFDLASDIKYLGYLNFDVYEAGSIMEHVDVRELHQFCCRASQPTGLQQVLAEAGLPTKYLHNGGNDAVYTVQAMIAIAMRQREKSLYTTQPKPGVAGQTVQYNEGWSSGGEDSDGGMPRNPANPKGRYINANKLAQPLNPTMVDKASKWRREPQW